MIIKEWSNPTKPETWAQFASRKDLLLILAVVGNFISGYSEFKSFDNWVHGVMAVLLLEGGIWFVGGFFFDNLFNSLRNKDIGSILFALIGLAGVIFIVYLSMNLSMIGKTKHVDETSTPPTVQKVDSSSFQAQNTTANQQYISDSLRIFAMYSRLQLSEQDSLKKNIQKYLKKKSKIMSYADYTYEKYVNSIRSIEKNVAANRKGLNTLNNRYKVLSNNALNVSKSEKNKKLAMASAGLVHNMDSISTVNSTNSSDFEALKKGKNLFLGLIVRLGIFMALIYLFLSELYRYLSGSKPSYKNPFGGVMSPFTRIKIGLGIRYRNIWEGIADYIAPTDEIKINGRKFDFLVDSDGKEAINIKQKKQPPTFAPTPLVVAEEKNQPDPPRKIGFHNDITEPPLTNRVTTEIQNPVFQDFSGENEGYLHNYESYDEINARLQVFDYGKHVDTLKRTYKRMLQMYLGEKKKTKGWEQHASNRLQKVMQLTNDLVMQGYKVTIGDKEIIVDPVTNPSLVDYKKGVIVFNAPNNYKFPIHIKYT